MREFIQFDRLFSWDIDYYIDITYVCRLCTRQEERKIHFEELCLLLSELGVGITTRGSCCLGDKTNKALCLVLDGWR